MSHRLIPFEGKGSGADELSWGQRIIWGAMCHQGSSLPMGGVHPLAAGERAAGVAGVAAGLRFLMGRHDSLRTRLEIGGGGAARQVVAQAGEVPLAVVEAGADDPGEVAARLAAGYRQARFDYAAEWPVRTAVVTSGGVPTHLAQVFPHLVGDAFGLAALRADLASLDTATGGATAPVTAMQPLEQVSWQRSPAGRRCSDRAVRYAERLLRGLPDGRFGMPAPAGPARSVYAVYESQAARRAVLAAAARTGVSTSSVLLAAFVVALARVTGENPVLTQVLVSNRFRPGFAASVSPVNQACLCVVDAGGVTFDEVVARAWHAAMGAYKHAYFDPGQMDEMAERVGAERGGPVNTACFFNDRRVRHREEPNGATIAAPAAGDEPRLTRGQAREGGYHDRLFLYVNDVPGTLSYELHADPRYLPPGGLEAVLRGMAEVAVAAAADPAAGTGVAAAAA